MKFFIDTANLNEIKEAFDLGVLDGVTTNPSLMQKKAFKAMIISGPIIKPFVKLWMEM